MLFSIITVVKNAEKTIAKCRESVLSQKFKSYEHLIVDGLSSDNTVLILNEMNKKNLRFYSEADTGIYNAMNKAISYSKGDYILFLNADDHFYSQDILIKISNIIYDLNPEIIYGDIIYKDLDKNVITRYWKTNHGDFNKFKWGWRTAHPAFIISRKLCQTVGFFNEQYVIASDFDFMIRSFKKSNKKPYYLEMIFVCMSEGGISSSGFTNLIKQNLELFDILKNNYNAMITPIFFLGKIFRSIIHYLIPKLLNLTQQEKLPK